MGHQRNEDINWDEMSIEDILRLAIADEDDAQEYYRRAAERVGSIHTRRLLMSLSAMEKTHAEDLRRELQEVLLQRDEETGIAD